MKISLLQPKIIRGDIEYNTNKIQEQIDLCNGDLIVLAEYALTGSLVLDSKANTQQWAKKTDEMIKRIRIPDNKIVVLNSLKKINGTLYNICQLLPTNLFQIKVYPDDTEQKNGILPGKEHKMFKLFEKRFKILICMDYKYVDNIPSDDIDFFIWIYHFTKENFSSKLNSLKEFVKIRKIPILISSLVSDKNYGFSTYIDTDRIISLSRYEGILEIDF